MILLMHRQETMSILGLPLMRYIDVNDPEEVLRAIRLTDPAVPPGGMLIALAASEIVMSERPLPVRRQ